MRSSTWGDRIAITVSTLCAIHCLLLPVLLVALPTLGSSIVASEAVHLGLLGIAIPISIFALSVGCKVHRRTSFIAIGAAGLGLMILGLVSEQLGWGHEAERTLTLIGAITITLAHVRNFKLCRQLNDCNCHQSINTPVSQNK